MAAHKYIQEKKCNQSSVLTHKKKSDAKKCDVTVSFIHIDLDHGRMPSKRPYDEKYNAALNKMTVHEIFGKQETELTRVEPVAFLYGTDPYTCVRLLPHERPNQTAKRLFNLQINSKQG